MEKLKLKPPVTNLILFLATVGTTLFVGYQFAKPLVAFGVIEKTWQGAVIFSMSLLGILGCHEMGHKLMAHRGGIVTSLPYFIPTPFFLGTFGAVIKMKGRAPNRNALFDVGAAGPIAGFLIMLPVLILGLKLSTPIPVEQVPQGIIGMTLPVSLLIVGLQKLIGIPEGYALLLHPMAFTGWIGMIITMLNLMPVGSLDGGHIFRALFGPRWHRTVSFVAAGISFLLGYWLMAMLMLLFASTPYVAPTDDVTSISKARKLVSLGLLIILVLCTAPL